MGILNWLTGRSDTRVYLVDNNTREESGPVGLNFFDYGCLVLRNISSVDERSPGQLRMSADSLMSICAPDHSASVTRFSIVHDRGFRFRVVWNQGNSELSCTHGKDQCQMSLSPEFLRVWLTGLQEHAESIVSDWERYLPEDSYIHSGKNVLSLTSRMIRTDSMLFNNKLRLYWHLKPSGGYLYVLPNRYYDFQYTNRFPK